MKRYFVSLSIVFALSTLLPACVAADAPTFTPTLPPAIRGQDPQNPHPATTDIPPLAADYTLSATVNPTSPDGTIHVAGTERVRLSNTGKQLVPAVFFNVAAVHYGWFTLDSATIDGTPAAVDQADVRFSFPEWPSLAAGDARTVGFTFHLDIKDAGDGFDVTRRDGDILRLGYWFPMLSDDHGYHDQFDAVYTAAGNFHVTLTAPTAQTLESTGVMQRTETMGDRITYTIEAPNVRDFVALLSSSFDVRRATTKDGVIVEFAVVPSHYADAPGRMDDILTDAVRSIEQMSAWVGPYPYPIYRVVDAGRSMPGGVEFPMLSMIGSRIRGVGVLVAHETSHQWFFGLLGTHPQTETWVDEGAASLFEQAMYDGIDVPVTLSRPLPCRVSITVWERSVSDRDHYFCVYDGGRALYAAIRDAMGSDRFLAALRDLYTKDRYGIISARDLLTNFQQHSATDLRPVLRDYVSYDWLDALPAPGG